MIFEKFKQKMIGADPRNKFVVHELTKEDSKWLCLQDAGLPRFYSSANPQGAEAYVPGLGDIFFISFEELKAVQAEYRCPGYFVIAVINGDPVAVKSGRVYRGTHGTQDYDFKLIADSFEQFIQAIIDVL